MINVTKTKLPELKKYCTYLEKIWKSGWVTNDGQFMQLLEKRLQEYLKVKNLLVVSNGTLAIQLILKALDIIGEVITTPFTFAATTNAIIWEGLTPIFADIDPDTFNIDPNEVEKKITDKTSAILAVPVYGNACDVEKLEKIAGQYNLKLIYDAAHTFGAEYKNQSLVSFGDCSTLSFHATKVFNTIEGGAIVVQDDELFEKLKLMRNFGIKDEEKVTCVGINAKMNEFQAVMGLCGLEEIEDNILKRKKIGQRYIELLKDIPDIQLRTVVNSKDNYSYMPVCFKDKTKRDQIYSELIKNKIKPRKYFYPLTTESEYFKHQSNAINKDSLKVAYDISSRVLCLPIYPDLDIEIVDRIVSIIGEKK
jgi:dTDP-4-amino-4,6-dideoxygalactose transaminase